MNNNPDVALWIIMTSIGFALYGVLGPIMYYNSFKLYKEKPNKYDLIFIWFTLIISVIFFIWMFKV